MHHQSEAESSQSRSYAIGLTLLSMLGRLVPHAPNVTPVGASSLFAGSRIGGYLSYLLPLAVMIATDPIVGAAGGAHSGYSAMSPVVYASLMINVWIGSQLVRKLTALRVGAAAFLCSLQFFVLIDLGVWFQASGPGRLYTRNLGGLLDCFAAALPFWGRMLAGDLLYSGAIFGIYTLLARRAAEADSRVVA
jgi:hypothetical protein